MLCRGDSGDYGRCRSPPSETPKSLGGCFSFRLARTLRCLQAGKAPKTKEKAYAKPLAYGYVVPAHLRYSQGGPSKENPLYFGDKKDNGLYYSIVHDENGVRVSMPTRELQGSVPKISNHTRTAKNTQNCCEDKENVDTCPQNNEVPPYQQCGGVRRGSNSSENRVPVACQNVLRDADPKRDVTTSKNLSKKSQNQCNYISNSENKDKLHTTETSCKLSDESGVGSVSGDDSGSRSMGDLDPTCCKTPTKEAPDAWDIYMGYVMRNIMKGGSSTPPDKSQNCQRGQTEQDDAPTSGCQDRKSSSDSPDYEPVGCYETLKYSDDELKAGNEGPGNCDKTSKNEPKCDASRGLREENCSIDSGTSSASLASTSLNQLCETKCAAHGEQSNNVKPVCDSLEPGTTGDMSKPESSCVQDGVSPTHRDRPSHHQVAHSPRRIPGVKGQLHVGVEMQENVFTVSVFSARCLTNRQQNPNTTWCVQVELTPDELESTCCTDEVRHTNAPVFNEKYSFSLLPGDESRRLLISLYQTRADKRKLAGCMSFGLKHLMESVNHISGWYYLLPASVGCRKHLRVDKVSDRTSVSGNIPSINADVQGGQVIAVTLPATDNGYGFTVRGSSPVVIARVEPGSPAQCAGLQNDDVIISINGQNVSRSTAFTVADLIKASKSYLLIKIQRLGGGSQGTARAWSTLPCRSKSRSGEHTGNHSTLSLSRSRSSTSLASLSDIGSCGSRSTVASAISQRTEEYLFGEYGVPIKPVHEINNNYIPGFHPVAHPGNVPPSVISTFESFTSDLTKMTNNLLSSPTRTCHKTSCQPSLSPLPEGERTLLGSKPAGHTPLVDWTQGCLMHSTPATLEQGFSDNTTAWSSPSCVCPENSPASNMDSTPQNQVSSDGEVFQTCRMTTPSKRVVSRCHCDDVNSSDLDLSSLERECWDIVAELDSSDSGDKSMSLTPVRAGNSVRPMQRRVLRQAFDSNGDTVNNDACTNDHNVNSTRRPITRLPTKPPSTQEVVRTRLHLRSPNLPSPALSTPRCDQDTMGTMLSSRYYSDDSPSIMPQYAEKDSGCSSASLDSRQGTIERLVRNEEDYAQQMGFGAQRFSRPLRHYILSAEEHLVLFQNVEKLLAISEFHVKQLQTDGASVDHLAPEMEHLQVASIYLQRLPLIIEAYRTYCSGLRKSLKLLDKLVKHRVFLQFLQNPPPQPGQLSIKDFIQHPQQHMHDLIGCFERLLSSSTPGTHENQMLTQLVQGFQSCLHACYYSSHEQSSHGSSGLDDHQSICSRSSVSAISRVSGGTRWSATSGMTASSRLTGKSTYMQRNYPSSVVGYPGMETSRTRSICQRSVARSVCMSASSHPGLPLPRASSTQSHLAVTREATLTVHSRETLLSDPSVDPELVELQGRLVFPKNKIYHLLAPTRHVVYAGDVLWEDRHASWVKVLAILLNDLMLLTRQEDTGQLRVLRDPIYFSDVISCNFDSANAGEFNILIHEQVQQMKRRRYIILRAANQELRCTWQQLLQQRVQAGRKQAEHFL